MAVTTFKDFYGWETGRSNGIALAGSSDAAAYINDGTARTGCYYGKVFPYSSGGSAFTRLLSTGLSIGISTTGSWMVRVRVFIRIAAAPNQNGTGIVDLSHGIYISPNLAHVLQINTDLTWQITNSFLATGTVTGGSALNLNTWYEVTGLFQIVRNNGTNDQATMSYTVNGQTLSNNATYTNVNGTGVVFDRVVLGKSLNQNSGVTVGEFHFDDLCLVCQGDTTTTGATVSLPASTRVRLIPINGQGSQAQWSGSYTDLQEIPLNTSGAGQTSSGAGQVTTFAHATATQFGLGSIDAVKAYGYVKGALSTQQIRLNGIDTPLSVDVGYPAAGTYPIAIDFTSYTPSTFDAMEFGVVNSTGASLTLGAIHGEVLYTVSDTNWAGCNAPTGLDPNAPSTIPGCAVTMSEGSDSGGGAGCLPDLPSDADSGGGAGCGVVL